MLLDSVLSTVVVRVDPFALCLLDPGWRLRLPGPPDVMFHFVLRGKGALRSRHTQCQPLERYSLAVVPPGVQHSLECGTEVQSVRVAKPPAEPGGILRLIAGSSDRAELEVACGVVRIEYGDSLGLFRQLQEPFVADLSRFPQVRSAFEGILDEQADPSPGSPALIAAFMSQCLIYLLRQLSETADHPLRWLVTAEDPGLERAVNAILADPARSHTVASLADEALMSRSVFAERFQAAFGCTPMAFLRDVRMRRAAQLLQQRTVPIDQVARRVGFSSRSHFSQAFSERFGVSPMVYRLAAHARAPEPAVTQ